MNSRIVPRILVGLAAGWLVGSLFWAAAQIQDPFHRLIALCLVPLALSGTFALAAYGVYISTPCGCECNDTEEEDSADWWKKGEQ